MPSRFLTALFAVLLMSQLCCPAMAQDAQGGLAPTDDPLGLWRIKPPDPVTPDDNSTAAAPRTPPPPSVRKARPRTEKPMHGDTSLYERKEFIVDNGQDPRHALAYFWKPPKTISSTELYPLVIVLHDARGLAPAGEMMMRWEFRRDFPAFVAVPVLPPGKIWAFPESFPDDPGLSYMSAATQGLSDVAEMIPALLKDNPVDAKRIYILGCAEGGFGAYGAAMRYPDIFAAAVPINGGWAIKDASALTKMPLFVLHGEQDDVFSPKISRDVAYYIQMYGGNVSYVQIPGLGHDCADPRLYPKAMWEWLFKQHKRRA